MKSFLVVFAVLLAGINAIPQNLAGSPADSRLVTDAISSAIEDVSQNIKDMGLDPLSIQRKEAMYALPVQVLFSSEAMVENVLSTGLSNIVINSMNYGVLTSRLSFDISLPLIEGSVENVAAKATFFGKNYEAQGSGKLAIKEIGIVGQVRVNIGIISGISISNISLDLTLGGIDSNVSLVVFGYDLSEHLNHFLGETIPNTVLEFRSEINELLEIIVLDILNDLL